MQKYKFIFRDGTKEIGTGETQFDAFLNIGCDHSMFGNVKRVEIVDDLPVKKNSTGVEDEYEALKLY